MSCVTFGVPGTQDEPPVVWIRLDGVDDLLQLVDTLSCIICQRSFKSEYKSLQQMENNEVESEKRTCVHICILCTKVPPLETVHGAQVTLLSAGEPQIVQECPGTIGIPNLYSFL